MVGCVEVCFGHSGIGPAFDRVERLAASIAEKSRAMARASQGFDAACALRIA
jgi:hypothetical protein